MKKTNQKALRKKFLYHFYRGNQWLFLLATLSNILMILGNLGISWLLQQVLDAANGEESAFSLPILFGIAMILFASNLFIGLLQYHTIPSFSARAMRQFKDGIFSEIIKKDYSAFSKENTSVYLSFLTNDASSVESNYLFSSFNLIMCSLSFSGAFAMMVWYSPALTLVAIVLALIPASISMMAGNRLADAEKMVSQNRVKYIDTLKDCLVGFSVIKSFKTERQVEDLLAARNQNVEDAKCRRQKISIAIQTISGVSGVIAQLGVFLVGAWLALSKNEITAGVVVVFVNLMNYIIQPITELPGIIANRKAALTLIDRIAEEVSSNVRDQGVSINNTLRREIKFDNVSFGYEQKSTVLKNITISFKAGKSYAIVGSSGCGKSTMLSLLMASQGDYSGNIFFDDVELRKISTASLYDLVSIIQQNTFVFNASIRDNVTMFKHFPKSEVEKAIELSGLADLIHERGESYCCGENGSGLSGGEKQRIAIARSLLRNTSVLLVDEATAALDTETAFEISNALLDLDKLTKIIVTHKLDEQTLRRYDAIITIKAGSVVEIGSFDELIKDKGYFYSLYTIAK